MKLKTWMEQEGVSDAELAEIVGVTRPQINRIKHGKKRPSLALLIEIWRYTKGRVGFEDFID